MTDLPAINDYMNRHMRQIQYDFDEEYPKLSKKEQKEAILQMFFSQNGGDYKNKYSGSAEKLRDGLEPYQGTGRFREPEPSPPIEHEPGRRERRGRYFKKYEGFAWFMV